MTAMTATPAQPAATRRNPAPGSPDTYRFALTAFPDTAGVCRNMASITAWQWGADRDDAELIAAELSGNAIRETLNAEPGPGDGPPVIVFRLIHTPQGRMRIEVWDKAGGTPAMTEPGPDAEHGRGLFLVNQLTAQRWGWYPQPGTTGPRAPKCVWAEIPAAPHPGHQP